MFWDKIFHGFSNHRHMNIAFYANKKEDKVINICRLPTSNFNCSLFYLAAHINPLFVILGRVIIPIIIMVISMSHKKCVIKDVQVDHKAG